jgi:hypothetical protein
MCLPAGRSFIGPFPPAFFAARALAAVILPPLLFFAILSTSLLSHDLLDLTDLFLHFTAELFVFPFSFQPGIHAEFSGNLFDLTHYLVKHAFRLVLRA